MIHTVIKEIFHTTTYGFTPLHKGLTNKNYLLTIQDKQYVVRIPYPEQAIMNRKQEEQVMQHVKCLDSETVYFNADTGVKISVYIPDALDYEECLEHDKIERCATLMRTLHQLENVDFSFNSVDKLRLYQSHVTQPFFDLSPYEEVIRHIAQKEYKPCLCHNDFVHGNILYTKQRDYLIDYEYAASNDPLFDVISFLGENQIFDNTLRERFYQAYFQEQSIPYEQLEKMETFQNVLWCNWAMMMYEQRKEEVYYQIAQDKYNALTRKE